MIEIENVSLNLKSFHLENINIKINKSEYFVLLGPIGSGKTLLLEIITGIVVPDSGRIIINNRDVTRLPPEKRNIGYVTQDYSLFDHMKVIDNITFGLRIRKVPKNDAYKNVEHIIEKLKIENILDKYPYQLSGGEKQKVSLARALAINPSILLLDEPLVSLDPKTREMFLEELKKLHEDMRFTALHVTHSLEEARLLSDRIGIINSGKLIQVGKFKDIENNPGSEFVASFLGFDNIILENALNEYLGIERDKKVAFKSDEIEISEDGIEIEIKSIINEYNLYRINAGLGNSDLIIKTNNFPEINKNKLKIKIKRFVIIHD
ncbi:MAG: ATP-binding cassette domain-containing protein [Thermoplasmata archaeon]